MAEQKRPRGRPSKGRVKLVTYVSPDAFVQFEQEAFDDEGGNRSDLMTKILERRYARKR